MKALAYPNCDSDRGYLCLDCVEHEQRASDYANLFFVTTKPMRVDGHILCQRCLGLLGSKKAGDAAQRIADFIRSGSWPKSALEGKE